MKPWHGVLVATALPFDEINKAAVAAYPGLLFQWFPHGKISGNEFKIGDLSGTPGESRARGRSR